MSLSTYCEFRRQFSLCHNDETVCPVNKITHFLLWAPKGATKNSERTILLKYRVARPKTFIQTKSVETKKTLAK